MRLFSKLIGKQTTVDKPTKEPDYDIRALHELATRIAAKRVVRREDLFSSFEILTVMRKQADAGLVSADELEIVSQHIELTHSDPLFLFFLMDCPQHSNPFCVSQFDEGLGWLLENHKQQQAAYEDWKLLLQFHETSRREVEKILSRDE